jgi:hypothetical protein
MLMADLVRASLQKTTTTMPDAATADYRLTPGLLEGLATGVAALLVLTPVRSALLRTPAAKTLGMLPDLVVTSTQIMIAAQAALYGGSLYGTFHYLQTFRQIPVTARSPTVDTICKASLGSLDDNNDQWTLSPPQQHTVNGSSSWNPQTIVLAEYANALQLCRDRASRQRMPEDMGESAAAGANIGGW